MKIVVVGAGWMGSHHARVVHASGRAQLGGIVDSGPQRSQKLAANYGVVGGSSLELAEEGDAAVIATPTSTHEEVALALIEEGLPLLIEKPLARDHTTADRILSAAEKRGVPIVCGFVERFNPAFICAREYITDRPDHLLFVRHSPKPARAREDVVADVAIHDIDLALQICGTEIENVTARGWSPEGGGTEIVDCSIAFATPSLATISASRWGQRKVRSLTIATPAESIEVDLLRHNVTVFRHVSHELVDGMYRADTVVDIPFVRHEGEPLAVQLNHFLDVIEGKTDPELERRSILGAHKVMDEVTSQLPAR